MNYTILMLSLLFSIGQSWKTIKYALRKASEDEYPYVIKLATLSGSDMESRIVFCSGSVLVSKWTLTAAYCIITLESKLLKNKSAENKGVVIYQASANIGFAYSDILATATYPNYFQKKANDIGLVRTQPVTLPKYGKVSPIDYSTLNGQQIAIVGYNVTNKNVEKDAEYLEVYDAIVMECPSKHYYPGLCLAPPCSTKLRPTSTCAGNLGGPTVHSSGIVGINVKGKTQNSPYFKKLKSRKNNAHSIVTVAVAVSPFIDWITRVLSAEEGSK